MREDIEGRFFQALTSGNLNQITRYGTIGGTIHADFLSDAFEMHKISDNKTTYETPLKMIFEQLPAGKRQRLAKYVLDEGVLIDADALDNSYWIRYMCAMLFGVDSRVHAADEYAPARACSQVGRLVTLKTVDFLHSLQLSPSELEAHRFPATCSLLVRECCNHALLRTTDELDAVLQVCDLKVQHAVGRGIRSGLLSNFADVQKLLNAAPANTKNLARI